MATPRVAWTTLMLLWIASSRLQAQEPTVIPLWPNGAPGFESRRGIPEVITRKGKLEQSVKNVNNPSLTVYLPAKDKASGAGIVICPGGGHTVLAIEHEGHNVGQWLADHGIAGFVLKYRLARENGSPYTIEEHAYQDAQRALRLVRSKAKDWNVNKLGIMGFSAGGDLVLYSSTKFDAGKADAADVIERESSRPDFQIAIYPAIAKNLTFAKNNPPALLLCGNQDRQNISEGLATLYLNMKQAGINTELHIYASVGHGFGLRDKANLRVAGWPSRVREWMIDLDMMKAAK